MSLTLLLGWIVGLAVTVAPFHRSVELMLRAAAGEQTANEIAPKIEIAEMYRRTEVGRRDKQAPHPFVSKDMKFPDGPIRARMPRNQL
jgi:hypothetical protein